ncbi:MAG: hypothetical protein WD988_02870 [Candidatus Curtissbacteria bacterium]
MKTVSIVRERGQLTIPEAIRSMVSWVAPLSAVSISIIKPDEIIIRPHKSNIDWVMIWEGIKKSRSISGKGKVNTAEFLQQDRNSH